MEKLDNFLVGNRNATLLGFAGGGSVAGAGADADDERSTTTTNSTDAMSCRSIYVKKPGQKQFTYASVCFNYSSFL